MSLACNVKAGAFGALVAVIVFFINYKLTGRADPLTAAGIGVVSGLTWRVWACFLGPDRRSVSTE